MRKEDRVRNGHSAPCLNGMQEKKASFFTLLRNIEQVDRSMSI